MSKEKKQQALVPKLQFPEFRDAGGWKLKPIQALARVTQGGTPDTSNAEYWGGLINWLTPAEMNKGDSPYIESTNRTLTEDGLHNCSSELLPTHSVIISTRAPIGHLAINTVPMAINQGCRGLVPANDARFLYYSLLRAKPRLMDFGAGNTFKELSGTALKRFELPTTSPAEQQKIADCLSSLDDLIAAEGRKLAALREHKKGLMQQLFPREGETVPRLRFPEFRGAGAWEKRLLKSVVESVKTGKLDANAMVEDGQYRFYTCAKNYYWIDNYAFEGEALLIAGNGAYLGYIHHYVGKFNAYQRTYVLQGFDVNVAFLKCFLDRNLPSRILSEKKDGNTPYIVLATITDMPLLIPEDVDEQQRIADCLSALDDLIAAQAAKLDALRSHKRGLMQQLFPAPEDISR